MRVTETVSSRFVARFSFPCRFVFMAIIFVLLVSGCSTPPAPITVSPQGASVRIGDTLIMSGVQRGVVLDGGVWGVGGGSLNGTISASGVYTPPSMLPASNVVTITYEDFGQTTSSVVTILNPVPAISLIQPSPLPELSNTIFLAGSGFVGGSTIVQDGVAIPTTVVNSTHLQATISFPNRAITSTSIAISNPAPGPSLSSAVSIPVAIAPVVVSPQGASVRVGSTLPLSGLQQGKGVAGGSWSVVGGPSNGTIGSDGVYVPPSGVPSPNAVTASFNALGQTATTTITLLNPTPVIAGVTPAALDQISNPIVVQGSGFVNGSQIMAAGDSVDTKFIDPTHIAATVDLASKSITSVSLIVANPGPGASSSAAAVVSASVLPLTISSPTDSIRVGGTVALSGLQNGTPVAGGTWAVVGGTANGSIGSAGVYVAPAVLPSPNVVTITYSALGQTATTAINLLNPTPIITGVTPATLDQISSFITVAGNGFVKGSQIIAAGRPVTTTVVDSTHLMATVILSSIAIQSLSLAVSNPGPGASVSDPTVVPASVLLLTVSPASGSVRVGDTVALSGMQGGTPVAGGVWAVAGGAANGSVDASGVYTPPAAVTKAGQAIVSFTALGQTATATVILLNPTPVIEHIAPAVFTQYDTNVVLIGNGFLKNSQIYIDGNPVKTSFVDSTHLTTGLIVPNTSVTSVALSVSNPDPGSISSNETDVPVSIGPLSISPATLTGGNLTAILTLPGMPPNPVVTMDGVLLNSSMVDTATLNVSGYLPFWKSGTSTIALFPSTTAPAFASVVVPIAATAVSYDAASRFAMQAGFGPRHDIIEHIQQIGLEAFVDEQERIPPDVYSDPLNGRRDFLLHIVNNLTQLRLRTAWAFQSFIPEQGIFQQQSVLPWEETLEADAFTNFRQIMLDTAGDPNVTTLLNLPGNQAPRQPGEHPNQNFAREFLQLFTIGPVMLNEDGSTQLDSSGNPVPAYGEDTVLDLSRAFTGWNYAPIVNKPYSAYGIDYTQPLIAFDWQHDHGSKTILGNIVLPVGQTAEQDRDQVLDGVFKHPNVPPFISRRLIQRLVKSQPSPAYIARISAIFEDDGNGTRGNLAAVVKAILLDPEARAGDTQPSADDGFVQDPLAAEAFAMILMGIVSTDSSASSYPDQLGEPWWFTHSVFAYYSPDYIIPGTSIDSPEFQLLTNSSIVQRSQLLWGIINGPQVGFEPWKSSWLNTTFPTLPSFVDALDHLLYHGRMSDSERTFITNYCRGLPDTQSQLGAALFLALNNDDYTVVH